MSQEIQRRPFTGQQRRRIALDRAEFGLRGICLTLLDSPAHAGRAVQLSKNFFKDLTAEKHTVRLAQNDRPPRPAGDPDRPGRQISTADIFFQGSNDQPADVRG